MGEPLGSGDLSGFGVRCQMTALVPDWYSQKDDAFEWVLALLINLHAPWLALLWRRRDFRARLWAQ
ncbi:hypothetical protein [Marinobacter sp.]|uniref:hypothetical protein n=1 Tax=Marinobacter sp. TaxID=50741 RepID=UPI0019F2D3D7|nr:hypothetical protein [Marinobacter sp.]MBE0485785.1 hypothetical protein [Marinobacter sp.]